MSTKTYAQLSVMMFLQFFIWGAWFVTLGTYLFKIGFSGGQVGNSYLMNNIAAVIAPFFVGMLADRFFPSQKVIAPPAATVASGTGLIVTLMDCEVAEQPAALVTTTE